MLKWFIDEQVEEEGAARKILDMLKKVEGTPAGLYALDSQLVKRG
jgi:ferritin